MSTANIRVALIYDFDGTLAPGNMQEYSFIPDIGMKREEFWTEVNALENEHEADNILAYMYHMIDRANASHKSVSKQDFRTSGNTVTFFNGVGTWFSRINEYGKKLKIDIEHYVISCGIKEMIEGTSIAGSFKHIFASSFIYNQNGVACWPAQGVNYTSKTQFLYRINKGSFNITDHSTINKYTPEKERYIPFKHMIYFGDGDSDVPCMKLVKVNGGYSVAVYKPNTQQKNKVMKLLNENRVDFVLPADYGVDKQIDKVTKSILDKIATDILLDKKRTKTPHRPSGSSE